MTKPEPRNDDPNKEAHSIQGQKNNSINKNKVVYFVIIITSVEKIDFKDLNYAIENKIEPSIIFNEVIGKEDNAYLKK